MIPPIPSLFSRLRPYLGHFPPFFLVFCAFSPSRRGGSNEPQAGTQGQETAGKRAKRGELPPSFDTPDANQRINWKVVRHPSGMIVMVTKSSPAVSFATATTEAGPFQFRRSVYPNGRWAGDLTVLADPQQPANAYLIYSVRPGGPDGGRSSPPGFKRLEPLSWCPSCWGKIRCP